MEWFVIQVKTGREEEFRRLSRTMPGPEPADQLLIPTRRLNIRRQGRESVQEAPVFPGYVFLATPGLSPEMAGHYRQISGFLRWLGASGQAQPLDHHDLDIVHKLLHQGEILGISRVYFTTGMRIAVVDGPLKGLEGHIIRVDKRKKRARVRLDLYQNSFEVDFGYELILPNTPDQTKEAQPDERLFSPKRPRPQL